jgi:hypothetical protein
MNFSEEHVTRAMARQLVVEGWEIVAVHPPDGQGPFVIPKPPKRSAIERPSYHPDIVALRNNKSDGSTQLMLVECKLHEPDLDDDLVKLTELSANRTSLLYALFRCQRFAGGPSLGVDYARISHLPTHKLPVVFAVAAMGELTASTRISRVGGFECFKYLFGSKELAQR